LSIDRRQAAKLFQNRPGRTETGRLPNGTIESLDLACENLFVPSYKVELDAWASKED